jgi:hypothetical protein
MLTVKKGDNEINGGRQKKGFLADMLWILKAEHGLPRILDWENIYVSEFGIIHEMAPD